MNPPKVSVIIPTYNRAGLIRRSIQSLLDQSNQDFEIWVIDDDRTDNTREVIASYRNDKIHYLRLEKNQGQCVARNIAIGKVNGEYVGFLDSDDEWLPTKIEKQLAVFKQSSDPELAAVYCGFIEEDEIQDQTVVINRENLRGDIYSDLLAGFCPSTPTMFLVKTSVLREVGGFDEQLPTFVDYDLWLRIAKKGYTFDYVDEPLIRKYEHAGAQIAKDLDKRKQGLDLFLKKWGDEIREVAGKSAYHRFRKDKIEALVKSVVENPGDTRRKDAQQALKLLSKVRSANIKLYAKGLLLALGKPG